MSDSKITIDGRDFDVDVLGPEARKQVHNIQVIDAELKRLHTQILIHQTARNAFILALQTALPKE
jgi:hypothetical protein